MFDLVMKVRDYFYDSTFFTGPPKQCVANSVLFIRKSVRSTFIAFSNFNSQIPQSAITIKTRWTASAGA